MGRKLLYFLLGFLLFVSFMPIRIADAASTFKGTFVSVSYDEREQEDGSIDKILSKITLQNNSGKTTTLNIDHNAALYVNNTSTTIEGFKKGMTVEATVNLRKVKELRGTSNVTKGAINQKSKQRTGVVTELDPKGLFMTVKIDGGKENTYYLNRNTDFIKGSSTVDYSYLYEGDRVKLKFSAINTEVVAEVEIIATGIEIANLYKATIQSVNTSANKVTVKNAQAFENWLFGTKYNSKLSTYSFKNTTPIYAGNKKITRNQLRDYKNSIIYFVTKKEFSKEVIEKIIVLQNNERTYYEPMIAVNTSLDFIKLKTSGSKYFHEGTILVRNGRLVEPSTLTAYGTAFVVTDGTTTDKFAHVINITNDTLNTPNLSSHGLYFGEIYLVDDYSVKLRNLVKQQNNYWKSENNMEFSISNNTNVEINYNSGTLKIIPNMDLFYYETYFGYFYVKHGHIQAAHILKTSEKRVSQVITGQIQAVDAVYERISVKNASQWKNGSWLDAGSLHQVELSQTMIIKDGKVIEPSDLKVADRVTLYTDGLMDAHVLLVN